MYNNPKTGEPGLYFAVGGSFISIWAAVFSIVITICLLLLVVALFNRYSIEPLRHPDGGRRLAVTKNGQLKFWLRKKYREAVLN